MQHDSMSPQSQKHITRWGLLAGILLIASNLRAPLTAVGSLLPSIQDNLSISSTTAGSLTTLPLLAFAVVSPFASAVAHRISIERTLFYALILLTAGLILRTFLGLAGLIAGTIIAGFAIAFGNVLLPALIKIKFPFKIGLLTGLFAVFMNIFGALASGLSLPLSRLPGWGWQGSLASLTVLSIVALFVWLPQIRKQAITSKQENSSDTEKNNIWKSPLVWNITVYMGVQSMVFFTMISWLPDILKSNGYTSDMAGFMLSLMQLAFIPFTFITPVLAEKMKDQKWPAVITGIMVMAAAGSLLTDSSIMSFIAVICIGGACGAAFSLSMMFFNLRSNNGEEASKVSGMAQSFGYLIAAVGPVLLGFMHDLTSTWVVPTIILGLAGAVMIISGIKSGAERKITSIA